MSRAEGVGLATVHDFVVELGTDLDRGARQHRTGDCLALERVGRGVYRRILDDEVKALLTIRDVERHLIVSTGGGYRSGGIRQMLQQVVRERAYLIRIRVVVAIHVGSGAIEILAHELERGQVLGVTLERDVESALSLPYTSAPAP